MQDDTDRSDDQRSYEWVKDRASENLKALVDGCGFEFPCYLYVTNDRGAATWFRYRSLREVEVFPVPLTEVTAGLGDSDQHELPLRIIFVDAYGKHSAHCVVDASGTKWQRGAVPPGAETEG